MIFFLIFFFNFFKQIKYGWLGYSNQCLFFLLLAHKGYNHKIALAIYKFKTTCKILQQTEYSRYAQIWTPN